MIDKPELKTLRRIARDHHFEIREEEVDAFAESVKQSIAGFDRLAAMEEPRSRPAGTRSGGFLPAADENRFGAWAWKRPILISETGVLKGKRIVVKDNVAVADIPMRNGSDLLEGFIPREDATVVTRILEAGGEILGKAVCEDLCFSGGSHTSRPRPVHNPRSPAFMAGGSSSGSAALVAAGEADMAIGGDQGGSVRIPSAWCGIFGLKPTWGLVPYTGAFPIEPSIDHLGPMAGSVRDVALLLNTIAGRDGLDSRQGDTPFALPSYLEQLETVPKGLRIGVLREGFGSLEANGPAEALVSHGAANLKRLGFNVTDVSVPAHASGLDIWSGIATEGAWSTMVRGNSLAHGAQGFQDSQMIEFYRNARRLKAQDYSPTVKSVILLGAYLDEKYGGFLYAKAQNLRRALRHAYDLALRDVDVLLMPTTPQLPPQLDASRPLADHMHVALNMMANTATFDATGHPAMSVPCGSLDQLPVGMMLVGRRFEEGTLLKLAYAFESAGYAAI